MISLLDIYKRTDRDHLSESWYELGMKKFKDTNWKNEIKSFHLSNKEIKDNFKNIASSLA